MNKDEFNNYIKTFAPDNEAYFATIACGSDERAIKEIVAFITANQLNCSRLWEDSEEGDRAYDDWEKLMEKVDEIENKYGL